MPSNEQQVPVQLISRKNTGLSEPVSATTEDSNITKESGATRLSTPSRVQTPVAAQYRLVLTPKTKAGQQKRHAVEWLVNLHHPERQMRTVLPPLETIPGSASARVLPPLELGPGSRPKTPSMSPSSPVKN